MNTDKTSLIYTALKGSRLVFQYYGKYLEDVSPFRSRVFPVHGAWANEMKLSLRNQCLLDLTNSNVHKFIWKTIDSILTENPRIEYLKWDANQHAENIGSAFLSADRQMHFWIDYTNGLYSVYEKIRKKYPGLIMQACSSGGGRLDFGSLKYHDEFWASDDTDPMKRLFIQYGTNLIYPPVATAAHVSTSTNHQTGIITPLKFQFDVAMTGRLGLELQPKDLNGEDSIFAVNAIIEYKLFRHFVEEGDLYRHNSPYDNDGLVSLSYISKDKASAVLFVFKTMRHFRGELPVLKLSGLNKSKRYKIEEINKGVKKAFWGDGMDFSGQYLMNVGVDHSLVKQSDSAVF